MPQLDPSWRKVILGATAAALAALTASIVLSKKKPKSIDQPDGSGFKPEIASIVKSGGKKDSEELKTMASHEAKTESKIQALAAEKKHNQSWNELVEDEEKQEILNQSKRSTDVENVEVSSPQSVPSNNGDVRIDLRRSHDSGVVSPNDNQLQSVQEVPLVKQRMQSSEALPDVGLGSLDYGESSEKAKNKTAGGSDSGQGSEADDGIRLAYHFYIPHYLCGKFIGVNGSNIKAMKIQTKCSMQLGQIDENGCFKSCQRTISNEGDEVQVCLVEGTRNNIDYCLDLIRSKFPLAQFPELSLEQINLPNSHALSQGEINNQSTNPVQPLQLGLTQGAMHEVYVSNIVCGGHIFLQQPTHPTHSSLPRLEHLMSNVFNKMAVPDIPRDMIEPGLVCVAKCDNSKWYRVQVVSYDASNETCDVKFVDYGGYYNYPVSDLKQIRSDFLSLPFQALECYLGNVIPPDGKEWPIESANVLGEMVQNQIISGRMLGLNEDYVPIVHLYGWVNVDGDVTEHEQQPRLLNRELVDRGVAQWTEHIIAT